MLETVTPKYNEITLEPSYAPVTIPHGGIHYPVSVVLTTPAPTMLETVNPKYNEITLEPTYNPVVIPHGGVFRPVPPIAF